MPAVDVSPEARADLIQIAVFGIDTFGVSQSERYQAKLENTFELLAMMPRIGLPTYDLREGLYRFPQKSHVIFYTISPDSIRIVRVLHGRADFKRFF